LIRERAINNVVGRHCNEERGDNIDDACLCSLDAGVNKVVAGSNIVATGTHIVAAGRHIKV